MATFGKTSIGASWGNDGGDGKTGCKFTLSETASVTKLTMYIRGTGSGPQVCKAVIYSDAAGSPNALLGTGSEITIALSQAESWVDLPFPAPVALSPAAYWLGKIAGDNSGGMDVAFDVVTDAVAFNSDTYADGPSDPFGAPGLAAQERSVYATYSDVSPLPRLIPSPVRW